MGQFTTKPQQNSQTFSFIFSLSLFIHFFTFCVAYFWKIKKEVGEFIFQLLCSVTFTDLELNYNTFGLLQMNLATFYEPVRDASSQKITDVRRILRVAEGNLLPVLPGERHFFPLQSQTNGEIQPCMFTFSIQKHACFWKKLRYLGKTHTYMGKHVNYTQKLQPRIKNRTRNILAVS